MSESALFTVSLSCDVGDTRNRKEVMKEEAIATCTVSQWSGFIQILAFSSVTGRPIFTVYPSVYHDGIRKLLHGEVCPRKRHNWGVMYVMWSRDSPLSTTPGIAFEPNHFVPLRSEPGQSLQLNKGDFPPLQHSTQPAQVEGISKR